MSETFAAYTILAIVAFLLHCVWERFHTQLYTGYEKMEGTLPVYLFATTGDVVYTLCAVFFVAIIERDLVWFVRDVSTGEYLFLALIGFLLALFVEYKAIYFKKWEYLPEMPIIPFLRVGLSPIAQMTVLLPFSVYSGTVVMRLYNHAFMTRALSSVRSLLEPVT